MKIAVVTGASSGMGQEFVKLLAEKEAFDEIWVIARRKDRLDALAASMSVPVIPLALDLSQKDSILTYQKLLEEQNPEVAVLVNGSGFGKFGAFTSISLDEYENMIDLNAKALISMTYVTLPYMKKGGRIYNIDSLSSFQPVPYINVYGATKALVLSFSRALNVELSERGIRVLAVGPGWVNTECFKRAAHDDTVSYYNRIFEPRDVVLRALRDMEKGKDVSVLGFSVRMQVLATKLLPHRLVMKVWVNQQKKKKNTEKIARG